MQTVKFAAHLPHVEEDSYEHCLRALKSQNKPVRVKHIVLEDWLAIRPSWCNCEHGFILHTPDLLVIDPTIDSSSEFVTCQANLEMD